MTFKHSLHELLRDIRPTESRRVGPTPRPVHPSHAPVRQQIPRLNSQHGGEIVLVHIACGLAELREFRVEFLVLDDVESELSVDLEPLGPLSPVCDVDLRQHVVVIASSPVWPGIVERAHEAVPGPDYVAVDGGEVVERDA